MLKGEFEMKDLGAARGFTVWESLGIDQKNSTLRVLERFQMTNAKPVSTS